MKSNKFAGYSKQKLNLIILKDDFLNDILLLRKKWNIPLTLYSNNDREEWFDFLRNHPDESILQVFTENEDETEKRAIYLRKIKDDPETTEMLNKILDDNLTPKKKLVLLEKSPELYRYKFLVGLEKMSKELNGDIDNILLKYKLSSNYKQPIKAYLIFDDFEFKPFIDTKNLKIFRNKFGNNERLYVEIYADTTFDDYKKAWLKIRQYQKNLIGFKERRKKEIINFRISKRILELKKQGKDYGEIQKIFREDMNLKALNYADIAILARRFGKQIKDA